VLLSAGDCDRIIPLANVEELAAVLKKAGADVTLDVQHASHGLVQADLASARRWLASLR
jgi:phospholipase/carboxylesterase